MRQANFDTEIWREVSGYMGDYEISSFGRIRSNKKRSNGKILIPQFNEDGYKVIKLSLFGFLIRKSIHRLVAEVFIPNPLNLPQVNHKDGIKTNNFPDNLEWVTAQDNMIHAFETGLMNPAKGSSIGLSKLIEDDVLEMRIFYFAGKFSQRELAVKYSITFGNVSKIIRGVLWTHVEMPIKIDGIKIGRERMIGSKSGHHTLIESDVVRIKELYSNGDVSQKEIADEYGVKKACIAKIIRKETWKHVV